MAETHATAVEMLWEADAPHAVLRSRFGFADTEAAVDWVMETLSEHWGIHADACERIVMSDRNALAWVDSESVPLLLKWSVAPQRFARLSAVAQLTNWLASRGVPVSPLVPALDGAMQVEVGGVSFGLQRKMRGKPLDVGDPVQVHAAGAALARLHDALHAYRAADHLSAIETSTRPLAKRISSWLSSCPDQVPAHGREALQQLVDSARREPPQPQLVHGDYRAANILCSGGDITAILDFEEARFDHRVVELARSAVLLGTLFHDWGPVSAEVHGQFRAGYESEHELSALEADWWEALVLWHSLTMVPAGDDPKGWGDAALRQLA